MADKSRGARSAAVLEAPADLDVRFVRRNGEQLAVLSFAWRELRIPTVVTEAEKAVIDAVIRGRSNAQIASERGRSARTIANQIASIFKKLGVHSRSELIARYTEPGTAPDR
jgi:DNA-binding NarL/FixJ family response regulator